MNSNSGLNLDQMIDGKIPGDETGIKVSKTICSICNPMSHCGIDAYVKDGVIIKVEGTKENPHNAGTLCSKGAANRQYIYHKDRILSPLIRKGDKQSGDFEPVSWEKALDYIAEKLLAIKKKSGPESVVFYAGYPKWMRPFLKRLTHNFGSPNYCTESSTCSRAASIAANLNYGALGRPETSKSKCLLVWSKNPFYSDTSNVRNYIKARENGLKIIEVGPLITPMTAHADIHLRIRPGTSGALALGMANVIIEEGLYDKNFVDNWTIGFSEYRDYVKGFTPEKTEEITSVSATLIKKAARLYATSKPAGMLNGANATTHHTNGIQNHRAITALVGLTGNYDVEGGNYIVPATYLYAPNCKETRESQFSQSRPFSDLPVRMSQDIYPVWNRMAPEAQAMHLPAQIRSSDPYPIKGLLCFGMNHRMWPSPDYLSESLKMLDIFIDVDIFMTDTAKLADVVLPACTSFERSELKFYAEQYVIWTQPVVNPIGESRPDSEIIIDLAKRLTPDDELISKGYEACINWILEPTGLKINELKKHPAGRSLKGIKMPPYKKYEQKGFPTPSGKMEFTSNILKEAGLDPLPRFQEPRLSPISTPDIAKNFSLILTTGARLPMFVHSRTFRLKWTRSLRPDPMADINPEDANHRDIEQGDDITLSSPHGSIQVKANLTDIVPPGVVNMFHAYPEADVNTLMDVDYKDPISGYPGFKALLCEVKKIN